MTRTRSVGLDPDQPVAQGWRVLRLCGRARYWHDARDARGFSAGASMAPVRVAAAFGPAERPVKSREGHSLLGLVPQRQLTQPRGGAR
jgi:hypothetical protein